MGSTKKCAKQQRIWDNAKKCSYEGVIVSTALYGTEEQCMKSGKGRKVNVFEMKCGGNVMNG